MNALQTLSEELLRILDMGLSTDELIVANEKIIEWENDHGRFRYDNDKQTMFVQPKTVIEHLDVKITILPSGVSFD